MTSSTQTLEESTETINKILRKLPREEPKLKYGEEFQTDFAADQFVRWLSVPFPLFLAFLLEFNGQFTGGDVSCLPSEDLKNYSRDYSLAFSTQVNTYCGTIMIDFKNGKDVQLYQHYFPYCLVFQSMVNALPYVLWSVFAVGEIQSNLSFIQTYLIQHFKDNIEPFMENDKAKRDRTWSKLEIETWCLEWVKSKDIYIKKYICFLKIIPILLSLVGIAVYFGLYCGLDIDELQNRFSCKVEDKITFKCVLSTNYLIRIIWWMNISILILNIVIHVVHMIVYHNCGVFGYFFNTYLLKSLLQQQTTSTHAEQQQPQQTQQPQQPQQLQQQQQQPQPQQPQQPQHPQQLQQPQEETIEQLQQQQQQPKLTEEQLELLQLLQQQKHNKCTDYNFLSSLCESNINKMNYYHQYYAVQKKLNRLRQNADQSNNNQNNQNNQSTTTTTTTTM